MTYATLYIGDWSSRCGACGGNAYHGDVSHVKGGPNRNSYAEDSDSTLDHNNGCGATFIDKDGDGAHEVRPDLPFSPERIARFKQEFDEARRCTVVRSDGTVEHDWEKVRVITTHRLGVTPAEVRVEVRKWSDSHGNYLLKHPTEEKFEQWQDDALAERAPYFVQHWNISKEGNA